MAKTPPEKTRGKWWQPSTRKLMGITAISGVAVWGGNELNKQAARVGLPYIPEAGANRAYTEGRMGHLRRSALRKVFTYSGDTLQFNDYPNQLYPPTRTNGFIILDNNHGIFSVIENSNEATFQSAAEYLLKSPSVEESATPELGTVNVYEKVKTVVLRDRNHDDDFRGPEVFIKGIGDYTLFVTWDEPKLYIAENYHGKITLDQDHHFSVYHRSKTDPWYNPNQHIIINTTLANSFDYDPAEHQLRFKNGGIIDMKNCKLPITINFIDTKSVKPELQSVPSSFIIDPKNPDLTAIQKHKAWVKENGNATKWRKQVSAEQTVEQINR